ncbi:MAG TPA: HEAT repeat domain-containing protein [Verrucomicrobiae bacterium]|nr:HEAT repeat domain-containing protein [Verrucomicrobiae bacterium]
MAHVFVSYYRGDGGFAKLLDDQLREAGFATWRDSELRAGDSWRDEIDQALRQADTVVVVMSKAAKASPYVNYEWAFALGAGLRVIPLLLGLRQEDLHPRLAHLQWKDFSDPLDRPWNELFAALKKTRGGRQAGARISREWPTALERAAEALNSVVPAERIEAIETLEQMNDPAAMEILADALQHPVGEVRMRVALALGARRDPRVVAALVEAYAKLAGQDDRPLNALLEMGVSAVPELIRVLKQFDEPFRAYSARALGHIGDGAAIPALCEALGDQDGTVRVEALAALGRFGARAPLQPILERLSDDSVEVRVAAAGVLGEIGGSETLGGLIRAMNDPEPSVRSAAFRTVERAPHAALIPALAERLQKEEKENDRLSIVEALTNTGDPAAVPPLLQGISDDSYQVRNWARRGLTKIGGAAAVSGLVDVIRDPNSRDRPGAAEALGSFKDPVVVAGLLGALRDPDARLRTAAAGALDEIADPDTVPQLIDALKDTDENVRRRAAGALGAIGSASGTAALIEALTDVKGDVRWAAANSLHVIADAAAVPALVEALDDPDDRVRKEAIGGLEQINTKEAREALNAFRRGRSSRA